MLLSLDKVDYGEDDEEEVEQDSGLEKTDVNKETTDQMEEWEFVHELFCLSIRFVKC